MKKKILENEKVLFTTILVEIFLLIFLIFLSVYFFRMQFLGQKNYNQAIQLRHESHLLASQLRQSSDDLTRMVRTYVETGDSKFESYFWDILAIRDGKKPRPINYERVYWDFMTVERPEPPFKDGEKAPLKRLMREAGFTEKEFQMLAEAQKRSDKLVWLERIAMHAMKGKFQDEQGGFSITNVPNPSKARQIVFGKDYHETKKSIMGPINDFLQAIDKRTWNNVNHANNQIRSYQWSLVCVFGVLIINGLLLLLTAKRHQKQLINKLKNAINQQSIEITERKHAEEALKQSESKFRQLAENINAAFWISSPDKKSIIYVSPGYEKIWGKDCKTFYDNPWQWVESIHADDRTRIQDAANRKQLKGTYDEFYRIVRDDGAVCWIHDRAFPLKDETGKIHRIVGIAVDVTDRKKAEELLRRNKEELKAVLDNSVDAIGVSQQGVHKFVNLAYLKMFGYQNANELIGKPIFELIAPNQRSKIRQFVSVRAEGKLPSTNYQTKGLKRDGIEFDMEVNVTQYAQGGDTNTLVILRDVTDLKRKEDEKNKLEKQLQQAQKMEAIGTLAGGIAHDFNNILAAMLGYAEMAREDSPPESTVAKDLDKVLEGGNRAKDLVQQILAFSRQNEMEKIPLQPVSVVKEAIKMLRPSLPTTIEINQDITFTTGQILADPTQIHQILMNLCTNAFHAMEETGGKLGISLKEVTLSTEDLVHEPDVEPGTFVQLSISDSGSGIAPEIKKKIFDPYFTTKETGKGTGMGLAIVHGIVKSYGGFISLYSEPGEGTAFHVFLPVIEKELLPEVDDVEPIPVGRDRILFIDDEEILAEMGKSMLERLGYHVTVRNNSIEALETFRNQPDLFDLVITDQTMPGMTGADIARRMIQIRPDIPIILCTGYSTVISEEKAKSMGIKEFALKPLSKKDIAVLIRKVLDNS